MNVSFDNICLTEGNEPISLFVGRLDPPTKAHCQIITDLYKKYKIPISIFIIRSDRNTFTLEQQKEILTKCLNVPFTIFTEHNSFIGNIIHKLRLENKEVKYFACGTDRKKSYEGQLNRYTTKFKLNIQLVETVRTNGISATNVRQAIKTRDKELFKTNMSRKVWSMWKDLN